MNRKRKRYPKVLFFFPIKNSKRRVVVQTNFHSRKEEEKREEKNYALYHCHKRTGCERPAFTVCCMFACCAHCKYLLSSPRGLSQQDSCQKNTGPSLPERHIMYIFSVYCK